MDLSEEKQLHMYELMLRIRLFEEKVDAMFAEGTMPGLAHLYIGEEAVAVGVCSALRADDYIASTHRGHGHLIAKGGRLDRMMAELFGRDTGYCKGKGGSMHIADLELGSLGAMGIVGSGLPIAVGSALSAKMQGTDGVTVCFFGDGASNQGTFHEALNLASIWKVPAIFVCENNQYAISMSQSRHQAITNIADRASGYGLKGVVVDGNDVLSVYEAADAAVNAARAGQGPSLIECKTYRWRGHFQGDPGRGMRYRSAQEIETWMARCPIRRFKTYLLERGLASEASLEALRSEIAQEVEVAVQYAKNSPFPIPQDAKTDVYSAAFAYVVDYGAKPHTTQGA